MTDRIHAKTSRRALPFAVTGLATFVGFFFVFSDLGLAAPSDLLADPLIALGGAPALSMLLAAVVSGLTVLNLAFFSHVTRSSARARARAIRKSSRGQRAY